MKTNRQTAVREGDRHMMATKQAVVSTRQTTGEGDRHMHTPSTRQTARTSALVTGVFFLISFFAAVPPAFVLYASVLHDPAYIVGSGADTRVFLGAVFEVITAIACIGTAVTLFPILRRYNEGVALGYVAARVFEA